MQQERKALRVGLTVIAIGLLLRILSSGLLVPLLDFFTDPKVASFLIYMETGRVVRTDTPQPAPTEPEETEPVIATVETTPPLTFSPEDAGLVELFRACDLPVDIQALLQSPLEWDLRNGEPTVLILHTHATESYTKTTEVYDETYYRTLNENFNMVRVGDRVAELLEAAGIRVIHDRTLHDHPSYIGSYDNSRISARHYLTEYPSISLILDLHRDAADVNGGQLDTSATVCGQESAQLMLVVGTNASGQYHPNWQQNMAIAEKLHVTLEKQYPGICRPLCFRSQRFNQDLLPGAMLVEVGAAGNTLPEALLAAEALAQAIITLADGTG